MCQILQKYIIMEYMKYIFALLTLYGLFLDYVDICVLNLCFIYLFNNIADKVCNNFLYQRKTIFFLNSLVVKERESGCFRDFYFLAFFVSLLRCYVSG